LGTLVQFNPETPRVSKVLDLSSGDSCSNWNIGLLDEFPVNYYMGAVSPIYKFLDLYELAHLLCLSLVQAIESKLNSATVLSDEDMDILTNGLNVTWSQWIISLRQQVLWMFNRSQNIAQFLTPQTGTGAFQPFLCGSNCYPAMPTILMKIPKFINENLRMLMMCVRPYHTGKFDSPNNNMTHVPVWGMYTTYTPVNYVIFQGATAHDLFLPEVSNNPSVFDGSYGSNVADFNNSDIVTSGINFWNEIVNACANQFGELDTMGGDSMGSPLLQYTRYVAFSSTFLKKEVGPKVRIPRSCRHFMKEVEVEESVVIEDLVTPRKMNLSREASGGKVKQKRKIRVYAPPESSPYNEFSVAISACVKVSESFKSLSTDFILPVIELEGSTILPSQNQVQTSNREPFWIKFNPQIDDQVFASRALELVGSVPNCVVGQAGHKTAIVEYMDELSKNDQGSTFGDIFSFLGNTANAIGI